MDSGLGDGIPLNTVTGRADLKNAVHVGGLSGTYASNPFACEAALAVFEAFEDGTLLTNAQAIEATARHMLAPLDGDDCGCAVPRPRCHAGPRIRPLGHDVATPQYRPGAGGEG